MRSQLMTPDIFDKATIVESWGFIQVTEYVFGRESNQAMELWTTFDPDEILILDKQSNQVTEYPIKWNLFIKE